MRKSTAIQSLPPLEYERFVEWFRAREQARWDEQMDRDSSSGKLDFLFDEAHEPVPGGKIAVELPVLHLGVMVPLHRRDIYDDVR